MTGQERNYGFMKLSELTAYELLGEQELKDIHSMGYIPVSYTHLTLPTNREV